MGISGTGPAGVGFSPGDSLWVFFPGLGYISNSFVFPGTNQWFQIVMLRSNGATGFYVNGASTMTTDATLYTPITPTAFAVGSGGTDRFFNGAIDDIRIYNFTLSASEVQELYQFESEGPCLVPYSATATATVADGFVVSASITDTGCGYTNAPLVAIVGGGGSGATATATVTNGMVVGITITDAGTGYTSTPIVYIYSPLGVQIGILQTVILTFSSLTIGSNYQLQSSFDLMTWTNQGSAFTATNPTMVNPQYFNVNSWGQLYFRVEAAP